MHSVASQTKCTTWPRRSFVPVSWNQPVLTGDVNRAGSDAGPGSHSQTPAPGEVLASVQFGDVRKSCAKPRRRKKLRFIHASPYGVAKVFGHYITVNYRGELRPLRLLGDWDSTTNRPGRGLEFVTRKVTHQVAASNAATQRNS